MRISSVDVRVMHMKHSQPESAADAQTSESMDMETNAELGQERASIILEQISFPRVIGNTSGLRDLAESVQTPMFYEDQAKATTGAPVVFEDEISGGMIAV